jgi:hypothetical protein
LVRYNRPFMSCNQVMASLFFICVYSASGSAAAFGYWDQYTRALAQRARRAQNCGNTVHSHRQHGCKEARRGPFLLEVEFRCFRPARIGSRGAFC